MWKSLLDSVVEAFAMCDPVAYMHYIECKRVTARQASLTQRYEGIHMYVDKWVAFSEQMGLWQDCRGAGAHRHWRDAPTRPPVAPSTYPVSAVAPVPPYRAPL